MSAFDVLAPFDRRTLATLEHDSVEVAEAALARAHAAYQHRDGWLPRHERLAILERAADLIDARRTELSCGIAAEGGKPLADAEVEVARAAFGMRMAAHELTHLAGREIPMGLTPAAFGRLAFTVREPRGVVLAISAFNHPVNLIVHHVAPAIAVGAPILVKPSLETPLSCQRVVSIVHEAGLPPAHCQCLLAPDAVAERLVGDPRVAFLSFVGSARVGWHLRSRLSPGATAALEHGGVAPVLVDESADLDDAVPLLVKGGTYHAGQVCVSVQRVYVHHAKKDELVERLRRAFDALIVGDPEEARTEVGPLIRPGEVTRVASFVDEAVRGGAELVTGGKAIAPTCYAPTLLVDPPDDARVSREEVFGPVVSVYGVASMGEAVDRANAADSDFQAAVFTRDVDTALFAYQRLRGTTVLVNDHTAFRADWMPFGGHGVSGLGQGGIGPAMQELTIERMLVFRSGALGP